SEILAAGADPVVAALKCVAARDFFDADSLGVVVDLILQFSRRVAGQAHLIAETRRPRREGMDRIAVRKDRSLNTDHVTVVKMESFANRQPIIREIKLNLCRGLQRGSCARYVKRGVQRVADVLVIGP